MSLKKIFFTLSGIALSILFTLLFLEICLYFFPVNEGLRSQPVNEKNPIFRFEANREVIYSKHWNFDIKNQVKVNNYGFVNNNDYDKNSSTPLISIIGDSYVEALMVPFQQSISGLLQNEISDKRVYSFAASGAGLSQHLIWANFAKEEFKSDYFIFVIIANDFMEALSKYGSSPGFHRFKINDDNTWNLELTNYRPSLVRKILRESKLAMYLITNLKIHSILNFELRLGKEDQRKKYVSNFDAKVSDMFWKDAKAVTDIYLNRMKEFTGKDNDKVLFVLDGIRPNLYNKEELVDVTTSFWYKIRKYFMDRANMNRFEVVDMQKNFLIEYNKNKKRFEFRTDTHWNSIGHKAVAQSILQSKTWQRFLAN